MPRIVTPDELRLYLNLEGYEERIHPDLLDKAIDSAESWTENYTGRRFSPDPALVDGADTASPVTRAFSVNEKGWVRIPDLRTATSVEIDDVPLSDGTDYELDVYNAGSEPHTSIKLVSYTAFVNPYTGRAVSSRLEITGRWGFNPAPDDVKDSILALAARQYRRKDAMFADVIDQGGVSFEYTKGVPNFITDILALYKFPRIAIV